MRLDKFIKSNEVDQKIIKEYQQKLDKFLDDYNTKKKDIYAAIDIVNQNYSISKKYFFNDDEHLFQMENTDHFYQMCKINNIKLLSSSPSENKYILHTDDGINFMTNNRIYTLEDIFARNEYSVPQLYQFKEFVVFDIGMNRGYASLKFANFDSCKAVYGFEINEDTYNFALENFNLNPQLKHKIEPYKFGLSDSEDDVDLYNLEGCDGISTTELEFTHHSKEWIDGKENMKIKKAHVKSAGSVISKIIKNNNITANIVIKIDTEGSESKIIDDLKSKGVLDKVDLIVGECHLISDDISTKLVGFKEVYKFYHTNIIYSFCYVKEKFYHELPLAKY